MSPLMLVGLNNGGLDEQKFDEFVELFHWNNVINSKKNQETIVF